MKILFCGGSGEVGASCILIKINGKNIVLDCGIRMTSSDQFPDLQMIKDLGGVDAILLSHAHMDHGGCLPILSQEYQEAKIYMTHASKDLLRVLLYDSLKIMDSREFEIPAFAEVHVENMLNRILCYSPSYEIKIFSNISITFYNAGHILGASSIYIKSEEGSIFYSGDFSKTRQRTVEGAFIPKLRPDVAIFESTYGDRLHSNRDNEESRLISKVKKVIENKGKILIPAFALGRAQEIILILKSAINKGTLKPFKIYVDGMVNDICRIYNQNPNYLRNILQKKVFNGNDIFYDDNIIRVPKNNNERENIINSEEPCCIISSSGMLTGGPSQFYAEKLSKNTENYIAITGYQDEESPGRNLLDLADMEDEEEKYIKLGDINVPVYCGIGKYGLSAHSDKSEIISAIHSLSARNVYLVHGNKEVSQNLGLELQKEYRRGQVYVPINGESFDILIKNPRKQILKKKLKTLNNKNSLIDDNNIEILWKFISENYFKKIGFTIEDLLNLWYGYGNYELNKLLKTHTDFFNTTAYFENDMRRPFIFYPVDEEDLKDDNEPMELNKMFSTVDEYFPRESGLYKKGANFEEKIVLLYFDFPKNIRENYNKKILEFEGITGWKVDINTECKISAAENLIREILKEISDIDGSISYYRNEDLFKVKLVKKIDSNEQKKLCNIFNQKTGLYLEFNQASDTLQNTKKVKHSETAMEQNKAFNIIDNKFKNSEDKLYRKSIKVIDGVKSIELSFISPEIGEKYINIIDEIEGEIWWPISINKIHNQSEILNIGVRLFSKYDIITKKNLAYLPKEKKVKAIVETDENQLELLKKEFLELTGIELIVIKK